MNDEDVNLNEVLISGKINVVTDTNDMFTFSNLFLGLLFIKQYKLS